MFAKATPDYYYDISMTLHLLRKEGLYSDSRWQLQILFTIFIPILFNARK